MGVFADAARVGLDVVLPLRHQVLRAGRPFEEARLPGDDDPETAHFAVRAASHGAASRGEASGGAVQDGRVQDGRVQGGHVQEGEVVTVVSVMREAPPWDGTSGWRLRGMATAPAVRGRGGGAAAVRALITHVAAHGGGLLWCAARMPAVGFYRRMGFQERGEPWTHPEYGPHVYMSRLVQAGSADG